MSNLDDDFLDRIAAGVRDALIGEPTWFGRHIFLGGGAPGASGSIRGSVADRIARISADRKRWSFNYEVYYPETLFDGLMSGPGRIDLLTLENSLATAVDAVVLVAESTGALAELGAFANNEKLRRKLIVVQKKQYEKRKSFVSHGPVRLMKDRNEGEVIYADFSNISALVDRIHDSVGRIRKKHPVKFDFANIIQAHNFVLPCLFLFEKLPRTDIKRLIRSAASTTIVKAEAATSSSISMLLDRGLISVSEGRFHLTPVGMSEFMDTGGWLRRNAAYDRTALDALRIEILDRERRFGIQ